MITRLNTYFLTFTHLDNCCYFFLTFTTKPCCEKNLAPQVIMCIYIHICVYCIINTTIYFYCSQIFSTTTYIIDNKVNF